MKLIFSRKGFDSAAGKVPSPIFPDGTLLSLPIPDRDSTVTYEQIRWRDTDLAHIAGDLTGGSIKAYYRAHLDPDLRQEALPRHADWKPCLGQVGASQTHLALQGVGVGDIFLFFGLFQDVERADGRYRFSRGSRRRHVIWGWLQVGETLRLIPKVESPVWAEYHPHFHGGRAANNTLYIASDILKLDSKKLGVAGAGTFGQFRPDLQLTREGENTSVWQLPGWMYPDEGRQPLSYHGKPDSWQRQGDWAVLQSAGRGQEFVLDCAHYPESTDWLMNLFSQCGAVADEGVS